MPSGRTRNPVVTAAPRVEKVISDLRTSGAVEDADAVQLVLDAALDEATRPRSSGTPAFAIPIDPFLHTRAKASKNIGEEVVDGWKAFMAGEWEPEKPQRAPHGQGQAKSTLNISVPKDLVVQVEAACDRWVAEHEWPTGRGYKLNARQLAVQWLAREFPAPESESEAAAE